MLNKTFWMKEFPHITEIMSNSMQGMIDSILYLRDNGYEIDFQPCRILGIQNYIYAHKTTNKVVTPEIKKQQNQEIIDLTFELDELKEQINEYNDIINNKDEEIKQLKSLNKKKKLKK